VKCYSQPATDAGAAACDENGVACGINQLHVSTGMIAGLRETRVVYAETGCCCRVRYQLGTPLFTSELNHSISQKADGIMKRQNRATNTERCPFTGTYVIGFDSCSSAHCR
jgi:hypothetical protein